MQLLLRDLSVLTINLAFIANTAVCIIIQFCVLHTATQAAIMQPYMTVNSSIICL